MIKQLDDTHRDKFSVALHAFVKASDDLVEEIWKVGPAEASRASLNINAEASFANEDSGSVPVQDAHRSALFAMVSSIDHARSFVIQLNSAAVSLSLSTTVRATLEAFARVHWLLAGQTTEDLLHRYFSLTERELSMQEKILPGQMLKDLSGADIPLADVRRRNQAALCRLVHDGKPLACSSTKLATEMASKLNSNGRMLYSTLSAVAHGEALGIHSFVESIEEDQRHFFAFKLPAEQALAYSEQIFSSLSVGLKAVMDYSRFPRASANEWGRLHDECLNIFTLVRAQMQ